MEDNEYCGPIKNDCEHDWKRVHPLFEESSLFQCKKCKIIKVDW